MAEPHPVSDVRNAALVGRLRLHDNPAERSAAGQELQTDSQTHNELFKRVEAPLTPSSSADLVIGIAGD
jgi:hypothetical protein